MEASAFHSCIASVTATLRGFVVVGDGTHDTLVRLTHRGGDGKPHTRVIPGDVYKLPLELQPI